MFKRWIEKLAGSNTLYYPGCVTRYALPEVGRRYEDLLRRAGIDFIVLPGEAVCCGSPVKRAGYAADFEELKRKNLEIFARFSIRKIITNCPGCYRTLKHDYGLEAYHVAQIFAAQSPRQTTRAAEPITYHDPCHLGRWSGIYDEPRQLLANAGWNVTELLDNREQSLCCGWTNLSFPVYSLVGGKWTSFRAFAEQVTDKALAYLGMKRQKDTRSLPIGGGRGYPRTPDEMKRQIESLSAWTALPRERLQTLFERYGTRVEAIATFMAGGADQILHSLPEYTRREMLFLVQHEKIQHLDDLILRRSMLAMLGCLTADAIDELAGVLSNALGWNDEQRAAEVARTLSILADRHGVRL